MELKRDPQVWNRIRALLFVFCGGMLGAVILALSFLYFLGPTGSYTIRNILLSPDVAEHLSYMDAVNGSKGKAHYIFDRIEFLHYNQQTGEWKRKSIEPKAYHDFYHLILGDSSLTIVPEHVVGLFTRSNPSILSIVVKREGITSTAEEARAFQEVQILPEGDYYRVQLRQQSDAPSWAYFFHEEIYSESLKVLLP